MRVHPWILFILSVMALAASRSGFAQSGEMGGFPGPNGAGSPLYPESQFAPFAPGAPGPGGFVPPPPIAPAGAWDPIAAGQNGGPGYHPDRLPWPHISPFENRYAEHTNERGLWFFQSDNSARRYFANLDYRYARYRRPDQTRVGADVAYEDIPGVDPNQLLSFRPVDTGVLYDSFIFNFDQVNTVAVNEQSLESEPTVNGFLVEWGYRDPGQNGFDFSVWYTPEAHWAYSRGFNPSFESVLTGENVGNDQPLTITNGLPIFNGNDFDLLVFDSFFGLDFKSVGGGADFNWNYTPIRQGDWYQIAPTIGIQTMYIGEDFSVQGVDSGGQVVFTTGGLATSFTPLPGFGQHNLRLLSEVNSYLAGPQIGLRFEVGGKNLKIKGHSQVGLAVNHERLELFATGVGNPFILNTPAPNPLFDPNFRFREKQEHTRLSPTTSHEIVAEANIFSLIPLINRVNFLEEAKFRIGYQINAAFEVQRPHRIVQYNGLPLIPAIRNDQETRWYVESYNFGVHWDY